MCHTKRIFMTFDHFFRHDFFHEKFKLFSYEMSAWPLGGRRLKTLDSVWIHSEGAVVVGGGQIHPQSTDQSKVLFSVLTLTSGSVTKSWICHVFSRAKKPSRIQHFLRLRSEPGDRHELLEANENETSTGLLTVMWRNVQRWFFKPFKRSVVLPACGLGVG